VTADAGSHLMSNLPTHAFKPAGTSGQALYSCAVCDCDAADANHLPTSEDAQARIAAIRKSLCRLVDIANNGIIGMTGHHWDKRSDVKQAFQLLTEALDTLASAQAAADREPCVADAKFPARCALAPTSYVGRDGVERCDLCGCPAQAARPSPCAWQTLQEGHFSPGCCDVPMHFETPEMVGWIGCPYCLKPIVVLPEVPHV
jgi:hypothetical protein